MEKNQALYIVYEISPRKIRSFLVNKYLNYEEALERNKSAVKHLLDKNNYPKIDILDKIEKERISKISIICILYDTKSNTIVLKDIDDIKTPDEKILYYSVNPLIIESVLFGKIKSKLNIFDNEFSAEKFFENWFKSANKSFEENIPYIMSVLTKV